MNVGISSSFSSDGGGGADRRAGCSAGFTYPAGGTGVGRMPRSRNGSTPGAAREAVSAPAAGLSNPVAITVTRISPCMAGSRSEEHTSELQSRLHLVCRLLLEKKNILALRDDASTETTHP